MRSNYPHITLFLGMLGVSALLFSCGGNTAKSTKKTPKKLPETYQDTLEATIDSLHIKSNYDMKTVDQKHHKEFIENLARIEDEFGEQWDFCTCVVKNDSIDKAFKKPGLGDLEFDRLVVRSDTIEARCKAFLVQSPSQTPEERESHKRKVRNCLKEAGIK